MLCSTLLVAVSALASFAAAQNSSSNLPPGIQPCCTVDSNRVPDALKREWCTAERNTCREACGSTASGGNDCQDDDLDFTCECRNGTEPNMSLYEQTVPGQMCRFWFEECINATLATQDVEQQEECKSVSSASCGQLLTRATGSGSSSSASPSATTTGSNDNPSAASSGAAPASSSPGAAAGLAFAREFGTPVFAGGLVALLGFAL